MFQTTNQYIYIYMLTYVAIYFLLTCLRLKQNVYLYSYRKATTNHQLTAQVILIVLQPWKIII